MSVSSCARIEYERGRWLAAERAFLENPFVGVVTDTQWDQFCAGFALSQLLAQRRTQARKFG